MTRQHIDVQVHSAATPAAVYALLIDGASWPRWSPIDSFELERPAPDGEPEGIGAVRIFRTGRTTSHERVIERSPDRRFGYELLAGMSIRGYRAYVDVAPDGDGTRIRWRSSFQAKVPGTGWLYRLALGRFIRQTAQGLAAHAATSTAPA